MLPVSIPVVGLKTGMLINVLLLSEVIVTGIAGVESLDPNYPSP